jgi:hypothetical protein
MERSLGQVCGVSHGRQRAKAAVRRLEAILNVLELRING